MVGGNLTLAKNMVAQVEYYDLQGKGTGQEGQHARTVVANGGHLLNL